MSIFLWRAQDLWSPYDETNFSVCIAKAPRLQQRSVCPASTAWEILWFEQVSRSYVRVYDYKMTTCKKCGQNEFGRNFLLQDSEDQSFDVTW